MSTLAYCALSFQRSVALAAGVPPLTSPPLTAGLIHHTWLEGHRLIYLKLHGQPDTPYWYGDRWTTALHPDTINQANLTTTTVFAAACYPNPSPMLTALTHAGATVICGTGPAWAKADQIHGADALGHLFTRLINLRLPPSTALRLSQLILSQRAKRDHALADALTFQLYQEDHNAHPS